MTDKALGGGMAFPFNHQPGMTLREYAAIKLRVPDSGTDWLDDIIRVSLRDEFAAKAMHSYCTCTDPDQSWNVKLGTVADWSYLMADAMLEARKS